MKQLNSKEKSVIIYLLGRVFNASYIEHEYVKDDYENFSFTMTKEEMKNAISGAKKLGLVSVEIEKDL